MTDNKHARTTYPKGKQELYQKMVELPKSYNVIALSKVNKVRVYAVNDDKEKVPQGHHHQSNKK